MNIKNTVDRLLSPWMTFFLPWSCASCRAALRGADDNGFCGRCWLGVPRLDGLVCEMCGYPLPDGGQYCFSCRETPPNLMIRAATRYAGVIPPAIWRFKYAGRRSMARSFARLMAQALERFPELQPIHALVPVPLHPSAERARGYNQAHELAVMLGQTLGRPVLDGLIVRRQKTRPSFGLNKDERQENLKGAFALGISPEQAARLKGTSLLLIDDVCTTRGTLQECARVLRAGRRLDVKALVVARD